VSSFARSDSVAALVHTAVERFGKLGIMVNNSGIGHGNRSLPNVTEEQFDRIFAVNVKSIYHSAIPCVRVFRRQAACNSLPDPTTLKSERFSRRTD